MKKGKKKGKNKSKKRSRSRNMNTPAKDKTQSYGRADEKTQDNRKKAYVPQMEDPPLPQRSPVLAELENIGQSVSTDTTEDEAAAAAGLAQLNA